MSVEKRHTYTFCDYTEYQHNTCVGVLLVALHRKVILLPTEEKAFSLMKYLQVKHLFYEIDFSQRDIFSVSSAIKKNVSKETLQSSYQYILLPTSKVMPSLWQHQQAKKINSWGIIAHFRMWREWGIKWQLLEVWYKKSSSIINYEAKICTTTYYLPLDFLEGVLLTTASF